MLKLLVPAKSIFLLFINSNRNTAYLPHEVIYNLKVRAWQAS